MKTYLVVNPWNKDVKAGQQIETASLHPALASHVRQVEVATPVAADTEPKEVATPVAAEPEPEKGKKGKA